jgi:hypothetical protein
MLKIPRLNLKPSANLRSWLWSIGFLICLAGISNKTFDIFFYHEFSLMSGAQILVGVLLILGWLRLKPSSAQKLQPLSEIRTYEMTSIERLDTGISDPKNGENEPVKSGKEAIADKSGEVLSKV